MVGEAALGLEPGLGPVVFVSYSRRDADWRRRFVEMLEPVLAPRGVGVWSDQRNVVGERWEPQITDAIERTVLALLLVSASFLASRFINNEELPALVERGVPLVPVAVRPCLWDEFPALRQLQWAHDPGVDGPLATAADPEGQIVRICQQILGRVDSLPMATPRPLPAGWQNPGESGGGRSSAAVMEPRAASPLVAAARPGELHGVPPLPEAFVARDELDGLRAAVLRGAAVGLTGKPLGLHGQGGIGKTVLAAAVARDETIRRHFPGGVFWVTVGETGDMLALQLDLLARLGQPAGETRSVSGALGLLRAALAERQCLLVVDDVWSLAAAQAFAAAGPLGRVLYTSRDARVLRIAGAEVQQVNVLPPAAARELLAGLTATPVDQLPTGEVDRVLDATGNVALALALIGAAVGSGGRGSVGGTV